MTAHPGAEHWLYPFYTVADCLAGAALELQESLECEHPDYGASEVRFSFWPELDDDQAEPPSDDSIVQSARGQKASRRRPPGL